MSDQKLRIPGPESRPRSQFFDDIFYVALVCVGLGVAAAYVLADRSVQNSLAAKRAQERELEKLAPDVRRVRELSALDDSDRRRREVSGEDALSVFRHGERPLQEWACRAVRDEIADGSLGREAHVSLLKGVDRRSKQAPWTCLLVAYHGGDVDASLGLQGELDEFWKDARSFTAATAAPMRAALDEVVERDRPPEALVESERFIEWLRLCGVHPDYEAAPACRRLLSELGASGRADVGRDIVGAVDRHLRSEERIAMPELEMLTEGLGLVARRGQPPTWTVDSESPEVYDLGVRVGATLLLCRIAHSPHPQLARAGSQELARTARMTVRGFDEHLLARWRETCRALFDEPIERDRDARVPVLTPHVPGEEDALDFSMRNPIERGACRVDRGAPVWTCATSSWRGRRGRTLTESLAHAFVETRYMEW
jgi:hypothetical protein